MHAAKVGSFLANFSLAFHPNTVARVFDPCYFAYAHSAENFTFALLVGAAVPPKKSRTKVCRQSNIFRCAPAAPLLFQ